MGTDISLFLEYRSRIALEWEALVYGPCNIPRNYDMFAKMAGVRSDGRMVLYTAKGIPDNLSEYLKGKYASAGNYEGLCHHASWLSKNEFSHCIGSYNASKQTEILEYKAVLASMILLEEYECNARIVFWFML